MATYNKFNAFVENQTTKNIDWDNDTFKVMLVNSPAPVNTNSVKADLTEITGGGSTGYTAGGTATTIAASRTGGTETITGTQVVFTGGATGMGPFRYAVLYDDTVSSPADPLIAWWDYGPTPVTLASTETFTVKFNNASPGTICTLT
jgi:hypothetical protein